ncbi:MAG TPA: DUF2079 domain-containing protein [Candidatus Baltobacteraceae bacterium]|nr:DUF2079 domain-containing protein [Candidatus Baltobacteraceae bacterium]
MRRNEAHAALVRIWMWAACFALVYFALGWDRYAAHHAGEDLGLFTQSISTVFSGFTNRVEGGNHFTVHFSPILVLCAPALFVTHSALALVAIQSIAGALVAPAIFLFARRRLGDALALKIGCVALLYPPLFGVVFNDFHEDGFVPAATLWLLWAVDARRWTWAAVFFALLLAVKEDQSLILSFAAVFGMVYFEKRSERTGVRFCATALVVALTVFVGFFTLVRPLAGATEAWHPLHFYAWNSPGQEQTPWWSITRPAYVLESFLPLLFIGLTQPVALLVVPGFIENLLSRQSILFSMGQYYAAVWIGYALFAFTCGIASVARRSLQRAERLVSISLVVCAGILIFDNPTHWRLQLNWPGPHDRKIDQVLAGLPPKLDVGTHDELFSHLGFDPNASLGLTRNPRFALVDTRDTDSYWVERMLPQLENDALHGGARLRWEDDGIRLYERVPRKFASAKDSS